MSKKKELKALRKRVAELESEVALLRAERQPQIQWYPLQPSWPSTFPQITCGSITTATPIKTYTWN